MGMPVLTSLVLFWVRLNWDHMGVERVRRVGNEMRREGEGSWRDFSNTGYAYTARLSYTAMRIYM